MAKTEVGVNDPHAVKLFSKSLAFEAIRKTYVGKFIGKGEDSVIQEFTDLKKAAGDQITFGLNAQLTGDGVQGDAVLEGREEALNLYDDKIMVDQLRHAVRIDGLMTEQRVPYSLRTTAKNRLSDWFAQRLDTSFFNQICGNTAQTDTKFTGNNAVSAPTTNRIIIQGGQSDDQSLTSSDKFTLDLVDIARQRAETASTAASTGPLIRPIMVNGEPHYVMFLHDYQVHDLRTNTATGQWMDIQKSAMSGGDVKKNPIFTGALGVYNGVILHRASRVTQGVNSSTGAAVSTVRRAVLCGAQAAGVAFGSRNNITRFSWNEDRFDYANQFGVSAGSIYGLKKTKFTPANDSTTNAEDFGSIVVSTYAAAATT